MTAWEKPQAPAKSGHGPALQDQRMLAAKISVPLSFGNICSGTLARMNEDPENMTAGQCFFHFHAQTFPPAMHGIVRLNG
jgi:hypothetical protein